MGALFLTVALCENMEYMPVIEFQDVVKKYKSGTVALDSLNFQINTGEFVFLIGPSGAGKSTVLKLLIREEKPSSGHVFVDEIDITKLPGRKIPKHRRKIGMIFQDFKLLPRKTVWENVSFSLEVSGQKTADIRNKTTEVLSLVGLSEKAKLYPNQISGGEAQRAAIARAVVLNPKILLADETTGNLDHKNATEVMSLLDKLNKLGTTIIMATHKQEYVNDEKHRVLNLQSGRIVNS